MRRIWAVIWKDTLTERRTKAAFNAMAFFAGIVLLIFAFALGPDTPGFGPAGQTLLLFPVMVPVVLGAVKATNLIINGTLMSDELGLWMRLLIVFDVIFVTVCVLTFEYVIEE